MPQDNAQSAQPRSDFQNLGDVSQLSDDQFLNWGNLAPGDGSTDPFDPTDFGQEYKDFTLPQQSGIGLQNNNSSTQLVRRNTNQQLARARGFTPLASNGDIWPEFGTGGGPAWQQDEDDEELDRRAAEAKRDAQSKRPPKQIPPFIQKLSR